MRADEASAIWMRDLVPDVIEYVLLEPGGDEYVKELQEKAPSASWVWTEKLGEERRIFVRVREEGRLFLQGTLNIVEWEECWRLSWVGQHQHEAVVSILLHVHFPRRLVLHRRAYRHHCSVGNLQLPLTAMGLLVGANLPGDTGATHQSAAFIWNDKDAKLQEKAWKQLEQAARHPTNAANVRDFVARLDEARVEVPRRPAWIPMPTANKKRQRVGA